MEPERDASVSLSGSLMADLRKGVRYSLYSEALTVEVVENWARRKNVILRSDLMGPRNLKGHSSHGKRSFLSMLAALSVAARSLSAQLSLPLSCYMSPRCLWLPFNIIIAAVPVEVSTLI